MNTNKTNKQHVIEVAANLFFLRGYHLTSMDEVVKESGVSKSNIYYHYKTKEELAIGVLKWRISFLDQSIYEIESNQESNVQEKIRSLYQLFKDKNGKEGGCPFITLYLQAAQQSSVINHTVKEFFENLFPSIENIITNGKEMKKRENQKLASFVLSSLEGALLLSEITSNTQHLDYSLEQVLKSI
ncbi:TetR/AcrR family transcriptional regulator [Bacillus carboniphilus]|uniref:TetR/AcrR family transcriptional regulator n=1 Tax=Bacillus carboniphilus TaxID=86663 RepID=A0ABY9JY89_9BACI|nr:TetR/AcrR family transcriptional regulator [Bacillus carboniphilus]WLR43410.1 TetR/AcrR family transcriptional regulator [Bacillus carboniphilus]